MNNEIFLLRDLIHDRTGLLFADGNGIEWLESLLKPLLERTGCSSHSDYYDFLNKEAGSGEWMNVITALSKPVSSFLRHREQIKVLVDRVIPQVVNIRTPLRIWSAGCATGQEPLSPDQPFALERQIRRSITRSLTISNVPWTHTSLPAIQP